MITKRKAWSKLQTTMALNSVKLLFITGAHAKETLPRPVAYLDRAVLVLAHEAIAATLELSNLSRRNRHPTNFNYVFFKL